MLNKINITFKFPKGLYGLSDLFEFNTAWVFGLVIIACILAIFFIGCVIAIVRYYLKY